MSTTKCKASDIGTLGKICLTLLSTLGLLRVKYTEEKDDKYVEFNNMTIINFTIKLTGPIYERNLTSILLCVQVSG